MSEEEEEEGTLFSLFAMTGRFLDREREGEEKIQQNEKLARLRIRRLF